MSRVLKVVLATVLLVMLGRYCMAQTDVDDAPHALPVSMITLIAEPVRKVAESVQVSGFLVLEFEGTALYLHREDFQGGLTRNAIRLSLTPEQLQQYKGLEGGYVTIEGSFLKRRNSEDIFTGSLFSIRSIRKTNSRR